MIPSSTVFYRLMLSLSVCTLLILSFLPLHYKQELHTKGSLHSVGHFAAFAVLTWFASAAFMSSFQKKRFPLVLAILAVAIETAQQRLTGAPMEWLDLLLDLAGISVATIAALVRDRGRIATAESHR